MTERNISDREYCEQVVIPVRDYLPAPLEFFANKIAIRKGLKTQPQTKWNNVKRIICTDRELADVLGELGAKVKAVVEGDELPMGDLPAGMVKMG